MTWSVVNYEGTNVFSALRVEEGRLSEKNVLVASGMNRQEAEEMAERLYRDAPQAEEPVRDAGITTASRIMAHIRGAPERELVIYRPNG